MGEIHRRRRMEINLGRAGCGDFGFGRRDRRPRSACEAGRVRVCVRGQVLGVLSGCMFTTGRLSSKSHGEPANRRTRLLYLGWRCSAAAQRA